MSGIVSTDRDRTGGATVSSEAGLVEIALVAAASGSLGYLLSLWRHRLHPWISLARFDEVRKSSDRVQVSTALSANSQKSFFMGNLPDKTADLGEVVHAFRVAKRQLELAHDCRERLESGLSQLKSSKDVQDVIKAVRFLLDPRGISDVLEVAVLREEIVPRWNPQIPSQLTFYVDNKTEGGCFSLPSRPRCLCLAPV